MPSMRFVMIGGFLGAGKTTTIAYLARAYQERGLQVAIITNDHASELVDTHTLRGQGFNVGEIPGACFCGNLDDLTSAIDRLGIAIRPDVVLVEPVGSCTDLVASVIRPMRRLYSEQFDVAPYGVLLKPAHGAKILRGGPSKGFSPQAEYIFRQQLAEADYLVLNRMDQLSPSQVDELHQLLTSQYPATPVLHTSAKTGQGMQAVLEMLEQRGEFGQKYVEIDYEKYAEGEADLGWLNGAYLLRGESSFDLDELLLQIVARLRDSLAAADAETAHLKAIGLSGGSFGVVNLVSSDSQPERSSAAGCKVNQAHIIVNARVAADPALLQTHVAEAVLSACGSGKVEIQDQHLQSFRPGRPALPKIIA